MTVVVLNEYIMDCTGKQSSSDLRGPRARWKKLDDQRCAQQIWQRSLAGPAPLWFFEVICRTKFWCKKVVQFVWDLFWVFGHVETTWNSRTWGPSSKLGHGWPKINMDFSFDVSTNFSGCLFQVTFYFPTILVNHHRDVFFPRCLKQIQAYQPD